MQAAELHERIRRALDLDASSFLVDEELFDACIEAYLELWDIMISAMGEEAPWEIATLQTTPGQAYIDVGVATGVYRMGRLDFRGNSESYEPLLRFNMATDPMGSTSRAWSGPGSVCYFARRAFRNAPQIADTTYRFFAWKIYFDPIPAAVHDLRLFYVPAPAVTLSSLVPTVYPDEWPDYVVNAVCAQMRIKEEADPTEFERARDRVVAMIERYSKPHQINSPQFMADHRRLQSPGHDSAIDAFWRR
jgi:hypothetical protein